MDQPSSIATFTIDGRDFADFEGWVSAIKSAFKGTVDWPWNGNLDAFDDLLYEAGKNYRLVWLNSDESRRALGYPEMTRWLANNLITCHPDNIMDRAERLRQSRLQQGKSMFEWLVEIIQSHSEVDLRLE